MAAPAIPTNFYSQTGNRKVFVNCDITTGATTYSVKRSTDGVTFAEVATPAVPNYLDSDVTVGTQYWYQMAAVNADGTSSYTTAQSVVPTPNAELSLGELRTRSQQRADRLNSNFVTLPEWNFFINQAMYELYDLLIDAYDGDYFTCPPVQFTTDGTTFLYPLPDGAAEFQDLNGDDVVAQPFYKLMGLDLGITANNQSYVTLNKFNFIDRNRYIYPNSGGTIYGVFNTQYRLVGNNLQFIPTPTSNQPIRIWYIPRLPQLLRDNDVTTIGFSGWLQYVIVRAAKYALDKEESDTSKLDQEITFLKSRIEETVQNRDAGQPDKISDTRGAGGTGYGPGSNFPNGGF